MHVLITTLIMVSFVLLVGAFSFADMHSIAEETEANKMGNFSTCSASVSKVPKLLTIYLNQAEKFLKWAY